MGKIFYETKMRIQTFYEISLGYWIIVTNSPENGWIGSLAQLKQSVYFSLAS